MSATNRRHGAPDANAEAIALFSVLALAALALLFTWVPVHVASWREGHDAPANPFTLIIGLVTGDVAWPPTATAAAVMLGVVVLILAALTATAVIRFKRRRARVDSAAARMGRGREVAPTSRREVGRTAERLGVTGAPGLVVARSVAGGAEVWQDWESVSVDIWGPRAGKTSSRAIPAIVEAPGAVVATSNKRDLCDATRGVREKHGRVWVFDPQGLVDEPVTWWWNPLGSVTNEVTAASLADVFAHAARRPGAKTDAYFDAAVVDLIANFLLAAALGGKPITQVYLWITDPNSDEPAIILDDAGFTLPAAAVRGVVNAPDKQRAGVYGTAQQLVSFLTNAAATRWVTPQPGKPQFDPEAFANNTDTLYSLSKEGRGNAGPLVTALTVAVCEAAEQTAKSLPGGRLRTPMVAVLDEAANVCRWNELPNLYSHYGSRGICVLTFLQSWSQGVEVWGREGMRKLWSASTVKVYGGGVSEVEFLNELSQLIGETEFVDVSTSYNGRGHGRSTSRQRRRERILDVADLGALDRGRVVVFAAGARPLLGRTQPWWDSARAGEISASLRRHDPASGATERNYTAIEEL